MAWKSVLRKWRQKKRWPEVISGCGSGPGRSVPLRYRIAGGSRKMGNPTRNRLSPAMAAGCSPGGSVARLHILWQLLDTARRVVVAVIKEIAGHGEIGFVGNRPLAADVKP